MFRNNNHNNTFVIRNDISRLQIALQLDVIDQDAIELMRIVSIL